METVVFVMAVSSYPVGMGLAVKEHLMLLEGYYFVSTPDFLVEYSVLVKIVADVECFQVCQEYYFVVVDVHKYFQNYHIVDLGLLLHLYLWS